MTQDELKEKFRKLYDYMAASNEPRYMKLFGTVMTEMMDWLIKNQPQLAEAWVEKLCAIKWEQYLTKGEAEKIIDRMEPEAEWDYDTWHKALTQMGLETERKGVFNKYALWVEMNAKYSDHAKTIAELAFGKPLSEIDSEKLVTLIHGLAVNSLTDEDGMFDIRKYYLG